jgi:hypothetical protein
MSLTKCFSRYVRFSGKDQICNATNTSPFHAFQVYPCVLRIRIFLLPTIPVPVLKCLPKLGTPASSLRGLSDSLTHFNEYVVARVQIDGEKKNGVVTVGLWL